MSGLHVEPKSKASSSLMAQVLERNNLMLALKQVQRNKGAPGVDGMTVDDLLDYIKAHWPGIKCKAIKRESTPLPRATKPLF